MKKILLIITLFNLAACDSETTTTAPTIEGNWTYTYTGSNCLETHSYNNGSYYGTSLDEILTGVYQTGVTVNGLIELQITFTNDNGLSDCLGLSQDDTGSISQLYYSVTSTSLNYYVNSTDPAPAVTLTRQ